MLTRHARFSSALALCSATAIAHPPSIGEDRTLTSPDSDAVEMFFGSAVDISGTTVVVGADGRDSAGVNAGAAYLFDASTGDLIATMLSPRAEEGDQFGNAVAMDGGYVVVGARGDDVSGQSSGAVFVFDSSDGSFVRELSPLDGTGGAFFGQAVAISGDIAAVGAPSDPGAGLGAGAVYLFDVSTGAQIAKVVPDDAAANRRFGISVGVSSNRLIVGAQNGLGTAPAGSAYLFDLNDGSQITKWVSNFGSGGDRFGWSVAINDGLAVVGSEDDDQIAPDAGAVYIFDAESGDFVRKMFAGLVAAQQNFLHFGMSVAVDSGTIISGLDAHAYVVDPQGTPWQTLVSGDDTIRYANSVAVSGNIAVVGGQDAVYVFTVPESCGPADIAVPFAALNFFDVTAFVQLYLASEPAADLAAPFGVFTIADLIAYIDLYGAGCP